LILMEPRMLTDACYRPLFPAHLRIGESFGGRRCCAAVGGAVDNSVGKVKVASAFLPGKFAETMLS
jgi:hypothetical protein